MAGLISAIERGFVVTLHSVPGQSGELARSDVVQRSRISADDSYGVNVDRIDMNATATGTARYAGIWIDGSFVTIGALKRSVPVVRGDVPFFPRGGMELRSALLTLDVEPRDIQDTTLLPKDNGAYSGRTDAESESPESSETGEYIGEYNMPPARSEIEVTLGPSAALASVDVFHTIYDASEEDWSGRTPPEDLIVRGSVWFENSFHTYDMTGFAGAIIEDAELEIDLSYVWIFGVAWPPPNPGVRNGPPNWSSTLTVAIDYITGTEEQLANIGGLFEDKASKWPYPRRLGLIDLMDYIDPPGTLENTDPGTLRIPIRNLGEIVNEDTDWFAITFTFDTEPSHFWMYVEYDDFFDDSTPYIARFYQNFNDSAFVLCDNPVTGMRLKVWYRRPVEETQLAIGGVVEVDPGRRITQHKARQIRGY